MPSSELNFPPLEFARHVNKFHMYCHNPGKWVNDIRKEKVWIKGNKKKMCVTPSTTNLLTVQRWYTTTIEVKLKKYVIFEVFRSPNRLHSKSINCQFVMHLSLASPRGGPRAVPGGLCNRFLPLWSGKCGCPISWVNVGTLNFHFTSPCGQSLLCSLAFATMTKPLIESTGAKWFKSDQPGKRSLRI